MQDHQRDGAQGGGDHKNARNSKIKGEHKAQRRAKNRACVFVGFVFGALQGVAGIAHNAQGQSGKGGRKKNAAQRRKNLRQQGKNKGWKEIIEPAGGNN